MVAEIIDPGLVAGWLGGLAALVLAVLAAAGWGLPAWRPLQLIAAFIVGDDALHLGWRSAALGFLIHMVVSGLWGVLFCAILPRGANTRWSVSLGLGFSFIIFALMTWLVLPWVDPILVARVNIVALLVLHLVYGAVLPLALPLRRSVRARRVAARRAHA
jgi:hypothetical protein